MKTLKESDSYWKCKKLAFLALALFLFASLPACETRDELLAETYPEGIPHHIYTNPRFLGDQKTAMINSLGNQYLYLISREEQSLSFYRFNFDTANAWSRSESALPFDGKTAPAIFGSNANKKVLMIGLVNEFRHFDGFEEHISMHADLKIWSFDITIGTWTRIQASNEPPERIGFAAAYNDEQKSLFVFGGERQDSFATGSAYVNDLWQFDEQRNTWNLLDSSNGPIPRRDGSITIDAVHNILYLWGGKDENGNQLHDLWTFDLNSRIWSELVLGQTQNYWLQNISYSQSAEALYLAGGTNRNPIHSGESINSTEVWKFEHTSGLWHRVLQMGTAIDSSDSWNHESSISMVLDENTSRLLLYNERTFISYSTLTGESAYLQAISQ